MKPERVKNKFISGYEHFCNGTSMHGFAELFNSYSVFWKLFWLLTCFGACAVSAYQIYESMYQYILKPTSTTSSTVSEKAMFYPALHLCFWQWFYWINWTVADQYPKDALLYAMHFVNGIFTQDNFNKTTGKRRFEEIMKTKNYTSLFQFYKSVARSVPISDEKEFPSFKPYFDDLEFIYHQRNFYQLFCYTASQESMYRYFQDHNDTKKEISFNIVDETFDHVRHMLTPASYTQYMLRWANRMGVYDIDTTQLIDLTTFEPTRVIMLFNDITRALETSIDEDAYIIDITAYGFTWLSDGHSPCSSDFQSIQSNTTCTDRCDTLVADQESLCLRIDEAIRIKKDSYHGRVCEHDVFFVQTGENGTLRNMTLVPLVSHTENHRYHRHLAHEIKEECEKQCVPACEQWNYQKSVTIKSSSSALKSLGTKNSTRIVIKYPFGTDVTMMTETDVQGWETFVGNVGGILGIWTGASLVSFVQLIYLCCFAEQDKSDGCFICCRKRRIHELTQQ